MHLYYEFIRKKEQLQDRDVRDLNHLLTQLTSHPRELTRNDIEAVIERGYLLFVRDLEANGRVVATATLVEFTTLLAKDGRIEDVVVDEEYRGNDISRLMVERLLSKAEEIGVERVGLTSNPARVAANALYRNMGFEQVHTNVYRTRIKK